MVCYLALRCGPPSTCLAGIVRCGPGRLAEELGRDVQDVSNALRELQAAGLLLVDDGGRVIYIEGVIGGSLPSNPDIATSYAIELGTVPDCPARDAWLREVCSLDPSTEKEVSGRNRLIAALAKSGYTVCETVSETVCGTVREIVCGSSSSSSPSSSTSGGDARAGARSNGRAGAAPAPAGVPVPGFPSGLGPADLGEDYWPKIDTLNGPTARQLEWLHDLAKEATMARSARTTVADAADGHTLTGTTVTMVANRLKALKRSERSDKAMPTLPLLPQAPAAEW